jgi:hypothetical protein
MPNALIPLLGIALKAAAAEAAVNSGNPRLEIKRVVNRL